MSTPNYAPNDEHKASSSTTLEAVERLKRLTKADLVAELIQCRISLRMTRIYIGKQEERHEDRARAMTQAEETLQRERSSNHQMYEAIEQERKRSDLLLDTIRLIIERP